MESRVHSYLCIARPTTAFSSSIFMHVSQMLSPSELRVFSTYRTCLMVGLAYFIMACFRASDTLPTFHAHLSFVDPQHQPFICSSYLVTLPKEGLFCYFLDALPVVLLFFPCATTVVDFTLAEWCCSPTVSYAFLSRHRRL